MSDIDTNDALEPAVAEVVRAHFRGSTIDEVTIRPDFDHDGEPILRVTVIFSSDMAKIDPGNLSSIARHVAAKLREQGRSQFPIFRFLSKRDSDRLRNEAA